MQGIAHRLAKSGAAAVLIKPGFVDTPMTAHIARKGPLWAKPERLAETIARAAEHARRLDGLCAGFLAPDHGRYQGHPEPYFPQNQAVADDLS